MDNGDQQQQQQQQQEGNSNHGSEEPAVLEDAPMGSDHGEESQSEAGEGDFVYVDDDELAQMEAMADEDEAAALAENGGDDMNDFETFQESEFAEGDEYMEGQVLQLTNEKNDSVAQFNEHHDSVYGLDSLPVAPFNLLVSGDGADKAFVWRLVQGPEVVPEEQPVTEQPANGEAPEESKATDEATATPSRYSVEQVCELPGHTETVEFCKFDSTGKWCVTGGMNNFLRVWDVQNDFALKKQIDSIPQEDMNFVEWHTQAPVLLTGGKDYMVWLVNAINGKVMANLIGHEDEVLRATFTKEDRGKHIVSCSADRSIRVWSPLTSECIQTMKSFGHGSRKEFHEANILCFALHPDMPVVLSGDESGCVFASQYMTGEINGVIGRHADSCESIAISPTQPIACSAGIDTKINVYDLTNFTLRLTVTAGQFGGFTKLLFSEYNQNLLIAASTMGCIQMIDPRNGAVVKTIKGHMASINDIKELKLADGTQVIATAGDDNTCLVYTPEDVAAPEVQPSR